jgi:hypothetical protein
MPYKSKAQMRYMHKHHPEIAKRWDEMYDDSKELPEHVGTGKFFKKAYAVKSVAKFMKNSIKPVKKFSANFASKLPKAKWANPISINQPSRTYG